MMKKKDWRFMALAVILAFAFVSAGCVQPSDGADETAAAVDPETGEQLVTVRIPTNAVGGRALTLEQAQGGIDFYEVVFKRADGRIYIASATKDKVLTVQLPSATYETVLLAGTSTGTLLASAYKAGFSVAADTKSIEYDLLALAVAVNDQTNKVAFTTPVITSPSGRTKDGSPYFSLPEGAAGAGTITIGNFPAGAIFDPAINTDSSLTEVTAAVTALAVFGKLDLVRLLTAYDTIKTKAGDFSTAAENKKNFSDEPDAKAYLAAALEAGALYEEMASLAAQIVAADPVTALSTLNTAIVAADDKTFTNPAAETAWGVVKDAFDNNSGSETAGKLWPVFAATTAWTALQEKVTAVGAAYIAAAEAVTAAIESGNYTAGNIPAVGAASASLEGSPTLEAAITAAAFPANLQAAFAAADTAITATTRVTMGSLGVDSTGGNPSGSSQPIVLPFAGGRVDSGVVKFDLGTPSLSGLTKLYYEFAFKAFGSSSANTWRIRDGLDNFYVDTGSNSGGSILLSVGAAAGDGIIIIKNGPYATAPQH
jgi:hypothetical protein